MSLLWSRQPCGYSCVSLWFIGESGMEEQEGSAGGPIIHPGPELNPSLIRNQLSRIVGSELFLESERMVRFLQFAVEETLKGHATQLKENVIGTHVFDRPLSYDPRIDPIVRVEARRLRA